MSIEVGGRAWPGERLDVLMTEAAGARAVRSLSRCVEAVEAALAGEAGLADAAPVARALERLERLTVCPTTARIDVGPIIERMVTAQLVASRRLSLLRTSIPALTVTGDAARCVLAVVRELLQVLDDAVSVDDGGGEASLAVVVGDAFIVFVGEFEREMGPVPSAAGAEALARLTRIAEVCGGAVKRRTGGGERSKVGVALGVRQASA